MATYFEREYAKGPWDWESCSRVRTHANINMFVEGFYHTLKEVYLERKQNRQVDHFLYKLRKISRDKAFEQWLKAEKGRWQWGNGKTWRHTNTQSQLQQKRCRERTWIVERCHHWMIKGKSTACEESRHHSVPAFSDALPVWLAFTSLTARSRV